MKRLVIIAWWLICIMFISEARVKTTRKGLGQKTILENIICGDTMPEDTSVNNVKTGIIIVKGYIKRAGDNQESFFLTNNTGEYLGHTTLTFLYTDTKGAMLHKRTENVECNLENGETRLLKIQSFDKQHRFYYYLGPRPRKSAIPYMVKVHIESYEIRVK